MIEKPSLADVRHTSVNIWTPPAYAGRHAWPIRAIVHHISQGTYQGSMAWASRPVAQASFHYIIDFDGKIGEVVDPFGPYAPWANATNVGHTELPPNLADLADGNPNANWVTVSVEFAGAYDRPPFPTDEQYEAAAELDAWLCSATRLVPIAERTLVRHRAFDTQNRPNCPGARFDIYRLTRMVAALLTPSPKTDAERLEEVYQGDPEKYGEKRYAGHLVCGWYEGEVLRCDNALLAPDGRNLIESNPGHVLDDWEQGDVGLTIY